MGTKGLVWSAAAMGVLLNEGIGDTIRASLTPRPGGDRREEVYAACELLQSLGLRSFSPSVTACPGCGRTTSTTFQELAERIQNYIRDKMPEWKTTYDGVETMTRGWGFSDFRPLQREAMHAVLAGRDSVVVLPTGGGKSLCFQAPALVLDRSAKAGYDDPPHPGGRGFGLVVSPLISLMKDQVDGLRVDGVDAAFLNSSQTAQERDAVVSSPRAGRCRLLYVSRRP